METDPATSAKRPSTYSRPGDIPDRRWLLRAATTWAWPCVLHGPGAPSGSADGAALAPPPRSREHAARPRVPRAARTRGRAACRRDRGGGSRRQDADQAEPRHPRGVPDAHQAQAVAAGGIDGNQVCRRVELLVEGLFAEVTRVPFPPSRSRHVLAQRVIKQPELVFVCVGGGDNDDALGVGLALPQWPVT